MTDLNEQSKRKNRSKLTSRIDRRERVCLFVLIADKKQFLFISTKRYASIIWTIQREELKRMAWCLFHIYHFSTN